MNAQQIYNKAERNGVTLECTCAGIGIMQWETLMEGATRADKKQVDKIVLKDYPDFEFYVKYYNPYNHYKTETHLIFVHSGIEHFFKINEA